MSHRATFFLSTGRCGTQWLARHLAAVYGDLATVTHEPLHDDYRLGRHADVVGEHLARIEATLETRDYIETGWPAWRAVPMLAEHFAGRFAVVHLTRHPVPVACSWVTHGMYRPPVLPGVHPEKVPLSPFEEGVLFPEYRDIWEALDPFQRCTYLWAEINAFGLATERSAELPWQRVRYEELFEPATLSALVEFLRLPWRDSLVAAAVEREDRFRYLTELWWDVGTAAGLPGVGATADALGYDLADVDEVALRRRYCAW